MQCHHFTAGRCQSCQWLDRPYQTQLADKQQRLMQLLQPFSGYELLPAVASAEAGFRYKAKMVVLGTAAEPILGIINQKNQAVDLSDCPLYPAAFSAIFASLKAFIQQAQLTPYDLHSRQGELKYLLLQQSRHSGQFMLRFVLRSKNLLARIKKFLPQLQQQLPMLQVITANIQPKPAAILEGSEEELLTTEALLREQLNQVPLYLSPQSFFQVNPQLAASLYATAAAWCQSLTVAGQPLTRIWDLFCGVGGFGLHLAGQQTQLTGIEISANAIASARKAASELQLTQVDFRALDASAFAAASQAAPDLLVVNPPRRGLGLALCQTISQLKPAWLVYSSCQASTLVTDLQQLNDYQLIKVQLFDFFAHSSHFEVLTLLQRKAMMS